VSIQGLIFDFDGTLADTLPLCCAAFREVTQRHLGLDYSDAEIVALFGPSEVGIFQQIAAERWETCMEDFLSVYEREHERHAALFPGVLDMLAVLAERQVRVAIVTGKGADSAAISLRLLGLDRHFEIVESGSPEGGVKPAAIQRITQQWELDPADIAYIGDAPSDITDARAAGVVPLAAAWTATADVNALEARDPAVLFRSVDELTDWIRHNTRS
jgi:HAD superfamily hydrolase (TIGR01549 family)